MFKSDRGLVQHCLHAGGAEAAEVTAQLQQPGLHLCGGAGGEPGRHLGRPRPAQPAVPAPALPVSQQRVDTGGVAQAGHRAHPTHHTYIYYRNCKNTKDDDILDDLSLTTLST